MCAHQLAGLLAELAAARSATAAALAERDVAVSGWQQEASARIGAEESERRMRKSCAVQVTERCKARVDLSGSREPPLHVFLGVSTRCRNQASLSFQVCCKKTGEVLCRGHSSRREVLREDTSGA